MPKFAKGDIVIADFPNTGQTDPDSGQVETKPRPVLILGTMMWTNSAAVSCYDCLVCMFTTQTQRDPRAISIMQSDVTGQFKVKPSSVIRPAYITPLGENALRQKLGALTASKHDEVVTVIKELLTTGTL